MSNGDALLRAIVTYPDEDTPRLMYADWLEENGDPARAEFIRDQVEWRTGSRDFDLLDENWDRWFPDVIRHDERGFRRLQNYGGGLAAPLLSGNTVIFTRGFVSTVWFSRMRSYFQHAESGYWRQQPVMSVRLLDCSVSPIRGKDTYYLRGLGQFPQKYWLLLENLPSEAAVLKAASDAAVAHGRELAGLPPIPAIPPQHK